MGGIGSIFIRKRFLVDYDSDDTKVSIFDHSQQIFVKPIAGSRFSQPSKRSPTIEDILPMQYQWFIGAMWEMRLFEFRQRVVKRMVDYASEPATKKT